ncbi:hypothetical protein OCU04_003287 [Sclerotinia nivalis]|uniref:Uncharacterized protein n=1 Tax=Sclerotinia nivalis TaxID=352851 RepID=A0A9X0DL73_9HELO|nr:hypothetical protein OCU04_003287 [Sclerotinia nivalis]
MDTRRTFGTAREISSFFPSPPPWIPLQDSYSTEIESHSTQQYSSVRQDAGTRSSSRGISEIGYRDSGIADHTPQQSPSNNSCLCVMHPNIIHPPKYCNQEHNLCLSMCIPNPNPTPAPAPAPAPDRAFYPAGHIGMLHHAHIMHNPEKSTILAVSLFGAQLCK